MADAEDPNVTVVVIAAVVGLAVIPLFLALIGLVGAYLWPQRWEVAGLVASTPPSLVFVGMIGLAIITDQNGEGGAWAGVLMVLMLPFLAWYAGLAFGGAGIGRWLGLRRQRRAALAREVLGAP